MRLTSKIARWVTPPARGQGNRIGGSVTDVTSRCAKCAATYRGRVATCPACGSAIAAAEPALRIGETIDGKYEVLSLLGGGGMGEVYKARHIHLDAFRTIKVMRKSLMADQDYLQRFIREARIATLVQHPNVAIVHDFATLPDGTYYMVSEFIEGQTVRQWIRDNGVFTVPIAVNIVAQVLHGLEAIHRAGLLHRDMSPDNVMLTPSGRVPEVKIIDLGIAKVLDASAAEMTQVGVFVGNPRYSSPEQLGALPDGEQLDGRSDLYCVGLMLYEMLAGVPPFVSTTPQGYVVKHLSEAPPPLRSREHLRSLPESLDMVVMTALQKNRSVRFASARSLAAALAPFANERAVTETQVAQAPQLRPKKPRSAAPPPAATMTPPPPSSDEDTVWEETHHSADRSGIQRFLKRFPYGSHAAEAHALLDEFVMLDEVQRLAANGEVSALTRLMHDHSPSGRVASAVREAIDRMAAESMPLGGPPTNEDDDWRAAYAKGTVEAWTRYLGDHPTSTRATQARRLRDEARDFASATATETLAAWASFLAAWPESRFRQTAEKHVERLIAEQHVVSARTDVTREVPAVAPDATGNPEEEAKAERAAWNRASSAGTKEAWMSYLEQHGNSEHVARAREMAAEASAFSHADQADTAAGWRDFLQRWPKGRHFTDAEIRFRAALDLRTRTDGESRPARVELVRLAPKIEPATVALSAADEERRMRQTFWIAAIAITAMLCLIAVVFAARHWQQISSPPQTTTTAPAK
jgi:serine/threonine protein kinase